MSENFTAEGWLVIRWPFGVVIDGGLDIVPLAGLMFGIVGPVSDRIGAGVELAGGFVVPDGFVPAGGCDWIVVGWSVVTGEGSMLLVEGAGVAVVGVGPGAKVVVGTLHVEQPPGSLTPQLPLAQGEAPQGDTPQGDAPQGDTPHGDAPQGAGHGAAIGTA